jgi:alkylhydroperoxidase family enzyme
MTSPRIAPATPPYPEQIDDALKRIMPPGVPPLTLFRVLARSERVFERIFGGGFIDKGPIALAEREIVIDRTCARLNCEYEWGVHVAFFAEASGLGRKAAATRTAAADDEMWTERERLLIRLVDSLCDLADIDDGLWAELDANWSTEQILELIAMVGFYHSISFLANATRLPPEGYAARFPMAGQANRS